MIRRENKLCEIMFRHVDMDDYLGSMVVWTSTITIY